MKHYLLLILMVTSCVAALARNDFWIGRRYSVSLSFGATDLGKKNAPTPKSMPPPEYPAEMIRTAITGEVTLDYTVGEDGRLSDLTVVKSTAAEFQKAVSAISRTWVFNPAIDLATGKPTSARMRCKVRFTFAEEEEPSSALQPTDPTERGAP